MHWRFQSYESDTGINQPRSWYEQQDDGVQAYVLAQVAAVAGIEDSPTEELVALWGRYSNLWELPIGIETDQHMRHVGLIGFWQPDSQNFLILICAEVDQGDYTSLLETALKLKRDWEDGKGAVHELFFDNDTSEFY